MYKPRITGCTYKGRHFTTLCSKNKTMYEVPKNALNIYGNIVSYIRRCNKVWLSIVSLHKYIGITRAIGTKLKYFLFYYTITYKANKVTNQYTNINTQDVTLS
jgi:hypothetical protein